MFTVYNCITAEHDLRLVALAGFICLFASFSSIGLFARAGTRASRETIWIPAAGFVAGCGIWATHFIAMLAFRPEEPLTYEVGGTIASFLIAVALSTAGFFLAARLKPAGIGGAVVGVAISVMHYVGMTALTAQEHLSWDKDYVAASVVLGVVLSAAAFQFNELLRGARGRFAGTSLLALAICALHFTGMAAVSVVYEPYVELTEPTFDPFAMALAIGIVAILIGAFGFVGAAFDRHLARRAVQEAKRLRAHVIELEETKRKLEATSEDLMIALRNVASADQAKSQFLATMSHELRTPLNAILGFSEIMKSETFGPLGNARYLEYTNDIFRSGQHLLSLINDVLDFTRADAGELQLHDEEVDITEIVRDAIRMMRRQAESHSLTLRTEYEPGLPLLSVDHRRVRQIMLNLLSNAVKFTPDGGDICVSVALEDGGMKIRVSDTGIGIAKGDIPLALERFGQIDSDLARKYEGTGLGLPLSKCLMEGHGGTLELESEPGRGTTVTLVFPPARLLPLDQTGRAIA